MFRGFIFLVGFYITYAQNDFNNKGEKDGVWIGYHQNGNLKYKGHFIENKEFGIFEYYDYNGNMLVQLNYIDPGSMSEAKIYDSNGFLKATGYYLEQEKHGMWTYFDVDKKKMVEENYINGVLHGEMIYYYKNNMIAEKYIYVNGLREGNAKIFYPSGRINMRGTYSQNKLHGYAVFYYNDNNRIESEGNYIMGQKDSIWIFYNELGDVLQSIDYSISDFQE